MKKISFKKEDAKVNFGLPSKLKMIAATALIAGAAVACNPTDDCTTTSTDLGNSADLGAQQDPNTFCDSD